jgi:hypothetical protein
MFLPVVFRAFFVLYDHRSRAYHYFIYGMPRLSRALLKVSTGSYGGGRGLLSLVSPMP